MINHDFAATSRRRRRVPPIRVALISCMLAGSVQAGAPLKEAELQQQLEKVQQMEHTQQQMLQQMQAMARQLESLQAELAATRAELAEQRAPAGGQNAQVAAVESPPGQTPDAGQAEHEPVAVSVDGGHLTAASADGDFAVELGGRLQFDAAVFDEDDGSIGNGSEVRRARLYLAGKFDRHWSYKNQIDFAGDGVSIKDAYLRYSGLPARITLGNFKEPFSLEELVSARFITFMERALPNVFAPSRNLGVAADINGRFGGSDGGWSAHLGVFGEGIDDSGFDSDSQREDDEGAAVTGRLTVAPIATNDRLVHLGGAASYRDTGDDTDIRLRQRFEAHIADRRLVDTGTVDGVDSLLRTGAEAAIAWGPFSLQGEYLRAELSRPDRPDTAFSGYYVYGSWFLTGESRAAAYSTSSGKFGRLRPLSPIGTGIGAWELAARFSQLDLTDRGISGGEEDNLTVALNWYPRGNLRLSANYVQVLDLTGGPHDGDEPGAFQMRAQVDF